jgi:thioredoxin-related protein
MKRIIETLTIVLLFICLSCSSSIDCEKLLSENVDIKIVQANKKDFIEKISILIDCSFDPIDKEILMGNDEDGMIIDHLFQFFRMVNASKEPHPSITFKDIKLIIEEITKSEEYEIAKQIVISQNIIKDRKASLSSWEEDSKLLIQMNFSEVDIAKIKEIIEENESKSWTYSEVFEELMRFYESTNTMDCPVPSYYNLLSFSVYPEAYFEYSEGLACSKISNKPVLLYFSAHKCLNSQQFESKVLSDPGIQQIINQKFVFINLVTDDKNLALPEYFICLPNTNDTIKQIGEINLHHQVKLFKSNAQPNLHILDSNGNQINDSFGYNTSIEAFKKYLIEGLESYYEQ